MIQKIKEMDPDTTFILSMDEYYAIDKSGRQQINKEIMKYGGFFASSIEV